MYFSLAGMLSLCREDTGRAELLDGRRYLVGGGTSWVEAPGGQRSLVYFSLPGMQILCKKGTGWAELLAERRNLVGGGTWWAEAPRGLRYLGEEAPGGQRYLVYFSLACLQSLRRGDSGWAELLAVRRHLVGGGSLRTEVLGGRRHLLSRGTLGGGEETWWAEVPGERLQPKEDG